MAAHERDVFADAAAAQGVAEQFGTLTTPAFLRVVINELYTGRIALVSSFGADAAVLLHMIGEIDRNLPVVFIDTRQLFPETLAYRDRLVELCGLTNVASITPDAALLAKEDPENFLWAQDPDRCCEIRKVQPLARALQPFDAWISGRKRFQSSARGALSLFEKDGEKVKVNPLARWTQADIDSYFAAHDLPRHALFAKGYLSIGCVPCTSPVRPGEDSRAGRWRGRGKSECGIHTASLDTAGT